MAYALRQSASVLSKNRQAEEAELTRLDLEGTRGQKVNTALLARY
jgi:hypothetical protein